MNMVAYMQGGIFKVCLVLIFSIQSLKKHTLNPEITLLYTNFMLKKPCLKLLKSVVWIFGLKINARNANNESNASNTSNASHASKPSDASVASKWSASVSRLLSYF